METPKNYSIGDNHLRGIGSTFTMLDKMLCDFERFVKGEAIKGLLYVEEDDLTDMQKRAVLEHVEAIREIIRTILQNMALSTWNEETFFQNHLVQVRRILGKSYRA
ncbi:MAG: hypothetical protein GXO82_05410 [Chlorobi bacterium]|nr:hypothetical protein [Chlorobiota bacterium]